MNSYVEKSALRVAIGGSSHAACAAALAFAKVDIPVTLYLGAEQIAAQDMLCLATPDNSGALAALYKELAEFPALAPVALATVAPGQTWVLDRKQEIQQIPEPQLAGVSGAVLSQPLQKIIGTAGILRSYLDRIIPVLTVGKTLNFARLVRSRQGKAAAALAATVWRARTAVAFEDIRVNDAAPGLNEALTRAGSLSGAIVQLKAAQPPLLLPQAGGLEAYETLLKLLRAYRVEVVYDALPDPLAAEPTSIDDFLADPATAITRLPEHSGAPHLVLVETDFPAVTQSLADPSGHSIVVAPGADLPLAPGDELIFDFADGTVGSATVQLRLLHAVEAQALTNCGAYGEITTDQPQKIAVLNVFNAVPGLNAVAAGVCQLLDLEQLGSDSYDPLLVDTSISERVAAAEQLSVRLRRAILGI